MSWHRVPTARLGLILLGLLPLLVGLDCDRNRNNEPFVHVPPEPLPDPTPGIEFYFREDGTEGARGPLEPGNRATLNYDLLRFEECDQLSEGYEAFAFVRPLGGDWVELPLTATNEGILFPQTPTVFIPSTDELQFTFFAFNESGCTAEDPAAGEHYRFPVAFSRTRALMEFGSSGDPTVTGVFAPESAVSVRYPSSRLPRCRAVREGTPTWRVEMVYTINQITETASVTAFQQPNQVKDIVTGFILPASATSVEIRFRNTDHTGCNQIDPPHGPGYRFFPR